MTGSEARPAVAPSAPTCMARLPAPDWKTFFNGHILYCDFLVFISHTLTCLGGAESQDPVLPLGPRRLRRDSQPPPPAPAWRAPPLRQGHLPMLSSLMTTKVSTGSFRLGDAGLGRLPEPTPPLLATACDSGSRLDSPL